MDSWKILKPLKHRGNSEAQKPDFFNQSGFVALFVNRKNMSETIKLDQFLKLMNQVSTGGHAKILIQSGEVKVNGEIETRRGRKLISGDRVSIGGKTFEVEL